MKPTMMNQEWLNHLKKIDWLMDRVSKLEQKIERLENPDMNELDDDDTGDY